MNPVLSYQTMKNDHLASLHQNLMNHLQHDFQPENTNSAHISYHISQSQPIASTKIKVKGKWVEKGVYPIPLKLLLPNPENFRFRTLLENYLAVNRKTMLNLNDNKDLQIIRRYLKESDPPKNAALKKDVLEKGLKNPIVEAG